MFENIKLPLPLSRRKPFEKNSTHVTTTDYLRYKVVLSREMMPNEKISVDARIFCRLTPMLKPAFARARFEHRLFFVPYRTVWKDFNCMISNSKNSLGVVPQSTGTITQRAFLAIFKSMQPEGRGDGIGWINRIINDVEATSLGGYDVSLPADDPAAYPATGNMLFFKLTERGRFALDLFQSLGYEFPYRIPHESTVFTNWRLGGETNNEVVATYSLEPIKSADSNLVFDSRPVSTLPLASALKIYRDWYLKGTVSGVKNGYYIDDLIEKISTYTFDGTQSVQVEMLAAAVEFMFELFYDNDYFTSASPTYMDTYGTTSSVSMGDASIPSVTAQSVLKSDSSNTTTTSTTPHLRGVNPSDTGYPYNITQYVIQSLCALTKWMRRNNIVGSKTLDRYLAHYGIKLESEKLNRSVYLGKFETEIDVQAVMANSQYYDSANDEVAGLGDFAGAGVGGSQGKFEFSADEFGQLIMISVLKPEVCYYQGTKRELFHTDRFSFYCPEFDNLGYQAVSNQELVSSFGETKEISNQRPISHLFPKNATGVHGFQPRYIEYKMPKGQLDRMTGNFRVHMSGASSYDYFNQFRTVFRLTDLNSGWVNEEVFQSALDKAQYDRIFASTGPWFDHFICHYRFMVQSWQPTMSPFDSFDLAEEEHDGHQSAVVNVGGTKF